MDSEDELIIELRNLPEPTPPPYFHEDLMDAVRRHVVESRKDFEKPISHAPRFRRLALAAVACLLIAVVFWARLLTPDNLHEQDGFLAPMAVGENPESRIRTFDDIMPLNEEILNEEIQIEGISIEMLIEEIPTEETEETAQNSLIPSRMIWILSGVIITAAVITVRFIKRK